MPSETGFRRTERYPELSPSFPKRGFAETRFGDPEPICFTSRAVPEACEKIQRDMAGDLELAHIVATVELGGLQTRLPVGHALSPPHPFEPIV